MDKCPMCHRKLVKRKDNIERKNLSNCPKCGREFWKQKYDTDRTLCQICRCEKFNT